MNALTLRHARRSGRRSSGFTLIELLLVMVIIAILASILVPKVVQHLGQAKETKAKADLATLKQSLSTFYIDNGAYPTTAQGLDALVHNPGNFPKWEKTLDRSTMPLDPWDRPYVYRCPGSNGDDFDVYSTGPSGQDGNSDNIKPD
jgi:general secretion pathway protein G